MEPRSPSAPSPSGSMIVASNTDSKLVLPSAQKMNTVQAKSAEDSKSFEGSDAVKGSAAKSPAVLANKPVDEDTLEVDTTSRLASETLNPVSPEGDPVMETSPMVSASMAQAQELTTAEVAALREAVEGTAEIAATLPR